MKKIIALIVLVMITLSACAESEKENGRSNGYNSAVYNGSYEGIGYNKIQELFPGGMITYTGYYSTYGDINTVSDYDQYVVNVMHKNMGLVQLIWPTGGDMLYINDIVNNSFFIKMEKKYFNEKDYFRVKSHGPGALY